MSEAKRVSHPKELLLCADVEGFDSLADLAPDMRSRESCGNGDPIDGRSL
jgi:hypothetical protein